MTTETVERKQVSIASLAVPSREVEVEFPGVDGFKVKVAFQSRDELMKLRKKATTQKFKNRQLVEEVDDQLFLELYVRAVIRGWTGLKVKHLTKLMLVDASVVDPEMDVKWNDDNALQLMKGSADFDSFITETISDISNFSKSSLAQSKT
jgi:hypothetical protein